MNDGKSREGDWGTSLSVVEWRDDDAELLRRARSGSRAAISHLYDRYCTDVNRLVRRVLGPDSDHDDLVNDIFVALIKNIGQVREPAKLRSWVMSVALNILRSELRKRTWRRRFFVRDPDAVQAVEQDPHGRALVARTFAIVERLSADDRIAFVLRYIDQRSLEETAEMCGCSLATIKRRIGRAERRFVQLASRDPALAARLDPSRWGSK